MFLKMYITISVLARTGTWVAGILGALYRSTRSTLTLIPSVSRRENHAHLVDLTQIITIWKNKPIYIFNVVDMQFST